MMLLLRQVLYEKVWTSEAHSTEKSGRENIPGIELGTQPALASELLSTTMKYYSESTSGTHFDK